jgi:hypothetical protein
MGVLLDLVVPTLSAYFWVFWTWWCDALCLLYLICRGMPLPMYPARRAFPP